MTEISATEAARNFADLLDAIEHRGEHFTILRRGQAVALLRPAAGGGGADAKSLLRRHRVDSGWGEDIDSVRDLLELDARA